MTRVISKISRNDTSSIVLTAWIETACAYASDPYTENCHSTLQYIFLPAKEDSLRNFFQRPPSNVGACYFHERSHHERGFDKQTSKSFRNRIFLSVHICHPSKSVIGFRSGCPVSPKKNEKNNAGKQRLARSYLDFNLRSRSAPESSSLGHYIFFFSLFFFCFI